MNNRKWLGLAIMVVGILVMVVIIYFLFFYDFNPTVQIPTEKNQPTTGQQKLPETEQPSNKVIQIKTTPKEVMDKEDLKRMAISFTERYGSFSNQSNFKNMQDLKIFMTVDMQKWVDQFITQETAKKIDRSIYFGITTKAVSQTISQYDDEKGLAKITVKTQKVEAIANSNSTISYSQDLNLSFVKIDGDWKVSEAAWQPKKQ